MKKSLLFLIAFSFFLTLTAYTIEAKEAFRYFTQPANVKGSKTPYGNNTAVGKYLKVDDINIYYEIYGDGKTVIVLHGGGVGTPYEMGKIIDKLRKNYRVVVISTRGHGRSEIGTKPLTYEQKANDIIAVVKKVSDEPVEIIGFSDGAYTAYKIASMYPNNVEKIVAIGAGSLKKGYFSGTLKVTDMEKFDKQFIEQQKKIMPEPERLQEFWDNYMKFWNEMEVGKELFSSIQCPVLLIAGDEDDHAPIITMLEAHQFIPNSRLCIIPKAWHSCFLDNFKLTWKAIDQFLKSNVKDLKPSKKIDYNNKF